MSPTRLRLAASLAVAAWVSILGGVGMAPATERRSPSPATFEGCAHVVNGVLTPLYPAVGALLHGSDPDSASAWCTGTLIGCRTFLTAAHCVCAENGQACQAAALDPSAYVVFFQHGGFQRLERIEVHPDYAFPAADLAVITLAAPVAGVVPLPINTSGTPAAGARGTIVGFGRTGGDRADYGLKRSGSVVIAPPPAEATGLLWWSFNEPFGDPGSNSNTCNGDSGGPLLLASGSGLVVAGVTSGGHSADCLADDLSFDTDIGTYAEWIAARMAPSDGLACGAALADAAEPVSFTADGTLDAGHPTAQHEISVPAGTALLRIGFNAVGDGESDFNFVAAPRDGDRRGVVACRRAGPGQYGFCELSHPMPGAWELSVERVAGGGPYQLTATAYAVDCRDDAQQGFSCDDGDPCTQGDACSGGVCGGVFANDALRCPYVQPASCPPAPSLGCIRQPVTAHTSLAWHERAGERTLTWRWSERGRSEVPRLDPAQDAAYLLCVYGDRSTRSQLMVSEAIPTASGWHPLQRGFRYSTDRVAGGGVTRARLRSGRHGRVGVMVEVGDASRLPFRLAQRAGSLTVQFHHGSGCWESRHQ